MLRATLEEYRMSFLTDSAATRHGTLLRSLAVAAGAVLCLGVGSARAQETSPPLEVGAVAPDFEMPGATRYGLLQQPVRLTDFRGDVVVLAFFYRARTKG
jgi:cytochrome oxidase Cu insertion factor (SCO1/SenC/PrrC family)